MHRVNRAVLPILRKQGAGLIITISSIMGRIVIPFAAPYTASKFALEGLIESLRYEVSGTGVDVVIVQPGGFGTNFMSNMAQAEDSARLETYGELQELPNQFWGGFGEQLYSEDAPNPQLVADGVMELINMPAGKRPLRTVIDPMTGGGTANVLNSSANEVQDGLLKSFGMGELLSVKSN